MLQHISLERKVRYTIKEVRWRGERRQTSRGIGNGTPKVIVPFKKQYIHLTRRDMSRDKNLKFPLKPTTIGLSSIFH